MAEETDGLAEVGEFETMGVPYIPCGHTSSEEQIRESFGSALTMLQRMAQTEPANAEQMFRDLSSSLSEWGKQMGCESEALKERRARMRAGLGRFGGPAWEKVFSELEKQK